MIAFSFEAEHTLGERREALAEYAGKTVTINVGGLDYSGVLVLSRGGASVAGRVYNLGRIASVEVHTGGDWATTAGHGSSAMTARLHVRCAPSEKTDIERASAADPNSKNPGEWMRKRLAEAVQAQRRRR